MLVDDETVLDPRDFAGLDCVLVDEAQFLPPAIIEDLRRITVDPGVPVICYGLRTDFKTRLFPGAQRLMELADGIEEVKVTCQYCQRKAICNLRFVNGSPTVRRPADPARRRRALRAGVLGALRRGDAAAAARVVGADRGPPRLSRLRRARGSRPR